MKLLHLLTCTSILVTTLLATSEAQTNTTQPPNNTTQIETNSTCGPRIRKAWTSLTDTEKKLYKDAIATAMDSGTYNRFMEIHTEMMSEREAHGQCMFVYWHRLFLVAFENMLRGQAPQYACVTLPYWDWMTEYNNFMSGRCSNVFQCSSFLKDHSNKPTNYRYKTLNINGEYVGGYCEDKYPLNRFCESRNVKGTQCAKCMPRGNWGSVRLPGSASFASIRNQLFGASNIAQMSQAIENGVHNSIHGTMGATMATYESPSDPIFWSHHAMIDLLLSIFHKCKVGEQPMTLTEKAANPTSWTRCTRRDGTLYNPFDKIMMRTGYMGQNPVMASQDPLIGKYFVDLPMEFAAQVDSRDMGTSSYAYQMEGLVSTLNTKCGGARRLHETSTQNQTKAVPLPKEKDLIKPLVDQANIQVAKFVNTSDATVRGTGANVLLETEKMNCMFQEECLGGVEDFPQEFKTKFRIGGVARCKQLVDRIQKGDSTLHVSNWKELMVKEFGCPIPRKQASVYVVYGGEQSLVNTTSLPTTVVPTMVKGVNATSTPSTVTPTTVDGKGMDQPVDVTLKEDLVVLPTKRDTTVAPATIVKGVDQPVKETPKPVTPVTVDSTVAPMSVIDVKKADPPKEVTSTTKGDTTVAPTKVVDANHDMCQ